MQRLQYRNYTYRIDAERGQRRRLHHALYGRTRKLRHDPAYNLGLIRPRPVLDLTGRFRERLFPRREVERGIILREHLAVDLVRGGVRETLQYDVYAGNAISVDGGGGWEDGFTSDA